uniref:Uncharacterized protein n=1 Tax=Clytia hemisphaerica TaxID=252671 RepID=A0A7M5X6T4_9CNID
LQHGHACSEGRCHKERTERCEENCQTQDGYKCFCKQDGVLKDKYCKPLPVNGSWSDWAAWSSCSVTCGEGSQTRQRFCDNPTPAHGGNNCKGDSDEIKICDEGPCPGTITTVTSQKSSYKKCTDICKVNACASDIHAFKGCRGMFSCSHGCKIRELGIEVEDCVTHCNGRSGCTVDIRNHVFHLCETCNRNGCTPSDSPTIDECLIGCHSYGVEF